MKNNRNFQKGNNGNRKGVKDNSFKNAIKEEKEKRAAEFKAKNEKSLAVIDEVCNILNSKIMNYIASDSPVDSPKKWERITMATLYDDLVQKYGEDEVKMASQIINLIIELANANPTLYVRSQDEKAKRLTTRIMYIDERMSTIYGRYSQDLVDSIMIKYSDFLFYSPFALVLYETENIIEQPHENENVQNNDNEDVNTEEVSNE